MLGLAGDGDEALQLARELRPDVVLMDLSMPVLDGWDRFAAELVQAVRSAARR